MLPSMKEQGTIKGGLPIHSTGVSVPERAKGRCGLTQALGTDFKHAGPVCKQGWGWLRYLPYILRAPQWLYDSSIRRLPNVTTVTHSVLQIPFEPYDLMVHRDGSNRDQSSDCGYF